jgi:DNA-binding transcriptional ArsR family regulator
MKEEAFIPLVGLKAFGLHQKIEPNDWILIDYMMDLANLPNKEVVFHNGLEYIRLNLDDILNEIPIFEGYNKSTLSRRLKKIKELGLVKFVKSGKGLYFHIEDICYQIKNFI